MHLQVHQQTVRPEPELEQLPVLLVQPERLRLLEQPLELELTLRIHPAVRLFRLLLLLRMFFHSMLLYTSSFLTSLIERNRNSFSGFFI